MKKLIFTIMTFVLMSALVACGEKTDNETKNPEQQKETPNETSAESNEENSTQEEEKLTLADYEDSFWKHEYKPGDIQENEEWQYLIYNNKYDESKNFIEIYGYLGTSSSVVVPDEIDGIPVTKMSAMLNANYAGNTDIVDIQFPDTLYFIASGILDESTWYKNQPDGLVYAGNVVYKYKGEMEADASISLKEETTGIAGYAFSHCKNMKELIMPDTVLAIGNGAFEYCSSLEKIQLSKEVRQMNAFIFRDCGMLKELYIPANVRSLNGCFRKSSLSEIYFEGTGDYWREKLKPDLESGTSVYYEQEWPY